jgi:A/G-specific adenine glycosylase
VPRSSVSVSTPPARLRLIRTRLLRWYRRHRRDLPWRRTRSPYYVLVSEIMLQQTQVETVIPYYERFIKAFPTIEALAAAPTERVLKLWEGLGYYSRARNLQRAAQAVVARCGGVVPDDPAALVELPGVGRYTAGAVASIAYGRPAPILDGNVKRVLCRLFALRTDPRERATERRLWALSAALLPSRAVADFNQGLMELGALVCTPKRPACLLCPVAAGCDAASAGLQDTLPVRSPRRAPAEERMAVGVVLRGGTVLMRPRPGKGLLSGLWGLPEVSHATDDTEGARQALAEALGLELPTAQALAPVRHVYTHKRVLYLPYLMRAAAAEPAAGWRWLPLGEVRGVPIARATRKILDQLTTAAPMAAEPAVGYGRAATRTDRASDTG